MRRVARSPPGIAPDDLDEHRFSEFLYTAGQPDPDLLIRTSGEMRVSNFLLWQIAYAEIWVTETLWPDFRRRASARSRSRLPEARSALRRHQAVARRARREVSSRRTRSRGVDSQSHCTSHRRQGDARPAAPCSWRWRRPGLVRSALVFFAAAEVLLAAAFVEYTALARASGVPVPAVPAGTAAVLACAAFARPCAWRRDMGADRRRADVGARRRSGR